MSYAPRIALAAAFVAFATMAHAGDEAFIKRFDGSFAGGGQVRMDDGSPHNISCKVSGATTASSINIDGSCSASMVTRKISANLSVGKNGVYTGTYSGANAGAASVTGRRRGDSVVLNVKWPVPVNGHTTATMILTNSGNKFSLAVMDETTPGGKKVQTTKVSLSRLRQVALAN